MNKIKQIAIGAGSAISGALLTVNPVLAQETEVKVEVPDAFDISVGDLLTTLLNLVLVIAAILVFAYLIWGGLEWITSGGDKSKTESARNKITAAIVGLVVLVASYAILQLVLQILGIQGGFEGMLNFATIGAK